jgi:glutathione synthase/RimK-type ligase-like ATP-grasp enzyme
MGNGWKKTGQHTKKFKKIKVGSKLRKLVKKVNSICGIKVLGIDLLRKNSKWYVLEANAQPGLDFFENERDALIEKVFNFLMKKGKKYLKK